MSRTNRVPNFRTQAQRIIRKRPVLVAVESVKFFKECFVKGGWTDDVFYEWAKVKGPLGGKKVLIGKDNTMNLMQSIRVIHASETRINVGSTLVYADIHNRGGVITVTEKMKRFWWAKYYEFAGNIKRTKDGKMSQSAGNKLINDKANYCKAMALMKPGSKIVIPKRQFIGRSKTLIKELEQNIIDDINKME